MTHRTLALFAFLLLTSALLAIPPEGTYKADVKSDAAGAAKAMARVKLPPGSEISLWAAEPLLANPVVFTFDHKGRAYVAETFRLHKGVTDIRGYQNPKSKNYWLDDDLACRTVSDRVSLMKKWLSPKQLQEWSTHHERIRRLEDTTGKGVADKATVFADGFSRLEDGIAAGVLARGDTVYYACIPDMWKLRDTKGTGVADQREKLSSGYGVHIGYLGHDLHGLIMGPDGKVYFSVGDRGLNVAHGSKKFEYPDTGAVLRCNPDGSDLEVFASGLRNPQELAFDAHGNLFTGDNNSDGGDRARWVYVVQGGDCGWRIGYQFEAAQGNRGPWNAEKLWHPPHEGQPAWVIPPVAWLGDGPSGLTYYPGVGLDKKYDGHFFMADFRGGAGNSGIRSFAVKPKGAGFELVDSHQHAWGVLATDVEFGPDCAMYVSDWVDGWGLTGKGRIYRVAPKGHENNAAAKEVKKLLGDGFDKRGEAELSKLLAHADMRVRQEAQFELAKRGDKGVESLTKVLADKSSPMARLHAIRGLGQCVKASPDAVKPVIAALTDDDVEVRANAARALGDNRVSTARDGLAARLADDSLRVRHLAAEALGRIGGESATAAVVKMIRDNDDKDVYVRHGGVMALAGCATAAQLAEVAKDASPAVRRAVVLAYRQTKSAEVAKLLEDADLSVATEAARVINDVPVTEAMPRLAKMLGRTGVPDPLAFRALNAAFRVGTLDQVKAVAAYAGRKDVPESLRVEAIKLLGMWEKPNGRDRILGVWRPLEPRLTGQVAKAVEPYLGAIFASGTDKVRKEATQVAAGLGIKELAPVLLGLIGDAKGTPTVRAEALRALASLKSPKLGETVKTALTDESDVVRAEARSVLAVTEPEKATGELAKAVASGTVREKQAAFDALAGIGGDRAEAVLKTAFDDLATGKLADEVRLNLIEAAAKRGMKAALAKVEASRPKGEPFGAYRHSIAGGDAEAGKQIFLYRSSVSCLRCHKANGDGAGEVGPDLTGIGSKQKPDYLLESILTPSKQIAKGYETVDIELASGKSVSGIVRAEDATALTLMTSEGTLVKVTKAKIADRRTGKSAMPDDLSKHLTPREMRDLIAYLASLKEVEKKK